MTIGWALLILGLIYFAIISRGFRLIACRHGALTGDDIDALLGV